MIKYRQIKKGKGSGLKMKKGRIRIYNEEGKTRDEREACFPKTEPNNQTRGAGIR